ncbi:MAG TPA: ester cyclase [Bradyrhizobium sp.]|uniref:ester cyclase n=1 Tax=Bradyrhizobium sp. TaxID=376 RepID=UPI002D1563CA|nr:ester cyclase [Bradyrhizobium sp.]HLZ01787.1 ester cyclase [Bradyrhizobium sp.]
MNRRSVLAGLAGAAMTMKAAKADTRTPAQLAEAFAATLSAHDMDAFAGLFGDDYVNHQVSAATPAPPPGTPPKQLTVNFFRARLKGLPDLKVSIEAMVATNERCAASFVYEGTHRGVLLGVQPTGKRLRFTSCDIFRVAGGKIVEHWGMGDIAGQLAQMKG